MPRVGEVEGLTSARRPPERPVSPANHLQLCSRLRDTFLSGGGGSPSFVHRKTCGDWLPHRRFHVGVEVARRGGQRSAELVRVAAGRRCAARGWLSHKHACQGCLTHALRSFWLERKIKEPDWEHISSSILFHFLI